MPSQARAARDSSLRSRSAPEEVTLVDWPLRDRPLASLTGLIVAGAMAWLAGWLTTSWPLGAIVAGILLITQWRTWLPTRYELTGSGISQSVLGWRRRIPWSAVRQYELHRSGVLLSPDPTIAPLTPLRGLYLHWGQQRAAVVAHLEYHVIGIIPAARESSHPPAKTDSKIA
jgi:hypothetical protein